MIDSPKSVEEVEVILPRRGKGQSDVASAKGHEKRAQKSHKEQPHCLSHLSKLASPKSGDAPVFLVSQRVFSLEDLRAKIIFTPSIA